MIPPELVVPYIITNVFSVLFLLCCFRWPNAGRLIGSLIFASAGIFNLVTANGRPWVYLDYGGWTFLPVYRDFIFGFFALHIPLIISSVAVCQIVIALLLWTHARGVQSGCLSASLFLVVIAPLGVGSAFPSSLVMGFGLYHLSRQNFQSNLPGVLLRALRAIEDRFA
jgi:hypothetical protein